MDELMRLHPNGLFLRREALDLGYRDKDLLEARRASVIERVRHGAYVPTSTWLARDDIERYRLRGQAVCLSHEGGRVALSHTSGAAEHGLRLWGVNTEHVHVVRLDGAAGRRQRDVVYHEDSWTPDDIYAKDELLVLGAEECALGAASLTSAESGVAIMDSLLDLDLGTEESVWAAYGRRRLWPRHAKVQIMLRLRRRGAQSIGESRTRHGMFVDHLPEPRLQYVVRDHLGIVVGITDFAWPAYRLLGEFDGMIKYGRLLKPGQTAGDAVEKEKMREDRLREVTGWGMIRFVWADLYNRRVTGDRVRRMMRMNRVA